MNEMEYAESLGVNGFAHPAEISKLVELAEGKDVLEVGSFTGLSAFCMGRVCKSLFSVDTHHANSAGQEQMPEITTLEAFKRAISLLPPGKVNYFVGTSEEYSALCPNVEMFDMIFIDAMHDYSSVLQDITMWWPRLRSGGIFAHHDVGHWDFPDVQRAFEEKFGPVNPEQHVITLGWVIKE